MPYLKMIWQQGTPPVPVVLDSWDYWSSVDNVLFTDSTGNSVTKSNKKIAYYAVAYTTVSNYRPVLISPDPDAVTYDSRAGVKTYNGTITDSNGIVWYYNSLQAVGLYFSNRPDFCINSVPCAPTDAQQMAQALLDRIYAVPFHADYQVDASYNIDFSTLADKEKTIRKNIGVFLFSNVSLYSTSASYQAFSDNADSFISSMLTLIGAKRFVMIDSITIRETNVRCVFYFNYNNNDLTTKNLICRNKYNDYGYNAYGFGATASNLNAYTGYVTVDTQGTITPTKYDGAQLSSFIMGVHKTYSSSSQYYVVSNSNLGVDF